MSWLNAIHASRRASGWCLLGIVVITFGVGYWWTHQLLPALALPVLVIIVGGTIIGVLMDIYELGGRKGREEKHEEMVKLIYDGKLEFEDVKIVLKEKTKTQ